MRIERASHLQDQELKTFYELFEMTSAIDLRLKRPQSFFAPYSALSDQHETLVLRDKDNSIKGLASFVFRKTLYENRVQTMALACDLRVEASRKAILGWSEHFLPTLRTVLYEKGASCVLSSINIQDQAAVNAFVRPRTIRRQMPRYHLYRKFKLVTLHGRFPWAPAPVQGLRIRPGENRWLGPLVDYIAKRAAYRAFCTVWDDQTFFEKLGRLQGLRLEDFLIAFDSQENVVGCLAPWSLEHIQEFCPLRYGLRAHNFRQFLKFGRALGWTRSLTKPLSRTGEEAPLKFRILTHLFADNEDVFESLVWSAFDAIPSDEFLVYAHCDFDFRLSPPKTWVSASLPYGLYSIVPPEMDTPSFLHPSNHLNPEIEASMIF